MNKEIDEDATIVAKIMKELWTNKIENKNIEEKAALAREIWDQTLGNLNVFKTYLKKFKELHPIVNSHLLKKEVMVKVGAKIKKIMLRMLEKVDEAKRKKAEEEELKKARLDDARRKAADKAAGNLKLLSNETKEKQLVNAPVAKNQDNIQNVPKAIVYAPVYKLPMDKSKPKKKSMFDCFPFCRKDDALGGGRKHKKRKTRKHKKRKTRKHKKRKIKKTRKHKKKKTKRKTRRKVKILRLKRES